MPLLKPPEPQIAMRKFFIRIEEPLARTMERYAEFLGIDKLVWSAGRGDAFVSEVAEISGYKREFDRYDLRPLFLRAEDAPCLP